MGERWNARVGQLREQDRAQERAEEAKKKEEEETLGERLNAVEMQSNKKKKCFFLGLQRRWRSQRVPRRRIRG